MEWRDDFTLLTVLIERQPVDAARQRNRPGVKASRGIDLPRRDCDSDPAKRASELR